MAQVVVGSVGRTFIFGTVYVREMLTYVIYIWPWPTDVVMLGKKHGETPQEGFFSCRTVGYPLRRAFLWSP